MSGTPGVTEGAACPSFAFQLTALTLRQQNAAFAKLGKCLPCGGVRASVYWPVEAFYYFFSFAVCALCVRSTSRLYLPAFGKGGHI